MAAMPREAVNDVLELGGALGTGAALHWYGKSRPSPDDIVPLVVNLVVSGVGVLGAMNLQGPLAFLAEGVATAGAAMAGARLVDMARASGGTTAFRPRFGQRLVNAPVASGYARVEPSGGNAIIEI